jgi:hypothetical protein
MKGGTKDMRCMELCIFTAAKNISRKKKEDVSSNFLLRVEIVFIVFAPKVNILPRLYVNFKFYRNSIEFKVTVSISTYPRHIETF